MIGAKRKPGRKSKGQKRKYFLLDIAYWFANPFLVVLAALAGAVVGTAWGLFVIAVSFGLVALVLIMLGVY